jgi:2-amino-4-hydroxy-6-hydroxymethyldihydropteridine diphosphokinase
VARNGADVENRDQDQVLQRGQNQGRRVSSAEIAYIGLGANLGDPHETITEALSALSKLEKTRLIAQSTAIVTKPWQADGPDFVNAVAKIETTLQPESLLQALLDIEQQFGRERPFKNAPRTLDLDLLLYGTIVYRSATLELPHPRMHERAFVLVPLLELAPNITIPGHGSAQQCFTKI